MGVRETPYSYHHNQEKYFSSVLIIHRQLLCYYCILSKNLCLYSKNLCSNASVTRRGIREVAGGGGGELPPMIVALLFFCLSAQSRTVIMIIPLPLYDN